MLLSRASRSTLGPPIPDDSALADLLATALRAPDHGRLRPWRFLVVSGAGLARLADAGEASLLRREPEAGERDRSRAREKLTRAPMVIVLGGHIVRGHKIPEIEQVLAIGAAGMNLLNGLHALGFAGKWVTGPQVYDPGFVADLGFSDGEQLYGMLMVGTAGEGGETPARPAPDEVTRFWR